MFTPIRDDVEPFPFAKLLQKESVKTETETKKEPDMPDEAAVEIARSNQFKQKDFETDFEKVDIAKMIAECGHKFDSTGTLDATMPLFQADWERVCIEFSARILQHGVYGHNPWFFMLIADKFSKSDDKSTQTVLERMVKVRIDPPTANRSWVEVVVNPRAWVGPFNKTKELPTLVSTVLGDRCLEIFNSLKPEQKLKVQFFGRGECQLPRDFQRAFVERMSAHGIVVDHNNNMSEPVPVVATIPIKDKDAEEAAPSNPSFSFLEALFSNKRLNAIDAFNRGVEDPEKTVVQKEKEALQELLKAKDESIAELLEILKIKDETIDALKLALTNKDGKTEKTDKFLYINNKLVAINGKPVCTDDD